MKRRKYMRDYMRKYRKRKLNLCKRIKSKYETNQYITRFANLHDLTNLNDLLNKRIKHLAKEERQ